MKTPHKRENKTSVIKVNMTPAQKGLLQSKAGLAGLKSSAYLLDAGLGRRVPLSVEDGQKIIWLVQSIFKQLDEIAVATEGTSNDALILLQLRAIYEFTTHCAQLEIVPC